MPAHPEAASVPRDFFCEHTESKSRLLALVDHPGRAAALHAVLTCRQADLAEEAARLLRCTLHSGLSPVLREGIDRISASLPDAPAASLRKVVEQVAQATWPSTARAAIPPLPVEADADDEDTDIVEEQPTTPHDAKLANLPGPVIRTIWLREFHVHASERVLSAARARGWQPAAADDLAPDDPHDVLGATLYLAEEGSDIPGADILADASVSELLSAADGDEVADWSSRPVTADFGTGWRRHRAVDAPHPRYGPTVPTPFGDMPDFAALFPTTTCDCDEDECECAWQLTARTADLLHTALEVLSDNAHDDVDNMGDAPVTPDDNTWAFFARLPSLTFRQNGKWRRQVAHACEDLAADLASGKWAQPTCTAEELVLHLALEDAPSYLDDIDEDPDGHHAALPAHGDDYDWEGVFDALLQDDDVMMLYSGRLDGIEDTDGDINQRLGIGDLRAPAWFEPFNNVPGRTCERTYRR